MFLFLLFLQRNFLSGCFYPAEFLRKFFVPFYLALPASLILSFEIFRGISKTFGTGRGNETKRKISEKTVNKSNIF